jgi:SAM-dependent methyltransferase
VTAQNAYDRLAPHYRAFASTRAAYLGAVDRFVVSHSPRAARMLDVGSGDGVRALGIARAIDAARLVLCEPSEAMAALCRAQPVACIWTCTAQCLPDCDERFDVITCLWNVLGHLPDRAARVAAFTGMRRLLAPGGTIFCDVNNRHNARAYGRARVMLRRLLDRIIPDERRGDSRFEWVVQGERIPAAGHLFTPAEMQRLAREAGLVVEERLAVDYRSGRSSSGAFQGQLVYRLRAAEASQRSAQR